MVHGHMMEEYDYQIRLEYVQYVYYYYFFSKVQTRSIFVNMNYIKHLTGFRDAVNQTKLQATLHNFYMTKISKKYVYKPKKL